jgi:hypothetical protein
MDIMKKKKMTIIPLKPDNTTEQVAGTPEPLKEPGSVTIENPDAPVNIGNDLVEVDGVLEGDKLEKP